MLDASESNLCRSTVPHLRWMAVPALLVAGIVTCVGIAVARASDADTARDSAPSMGPGRQSAATPESAAADAVRQSQFNAVRAIAQTDGAVHVIVELKVPDVSALLGASRRARGDAAKAADARLAAAISATAQAEVARLQGTVHAVRRTYTSVPFFAARVSLDALARLEASAGVVGISEDKLYAPTLDNTVVIVGAPPVWTTGHDGAGWHVAILDTGIRASHDFFAGKSIVQACFALGQDGIGPAGNCPNGLTVDTVSADAARHHSTSPSNDHGTHVAGIATGNDPGVLLYGVAPGADIIAIQVFSQFFAEPACGGGNCVLSWGSDQIAGLDYVYSVRNTYDIASANMSLGGGFYDNQATCDANHPGQKAAIDNLRAADIATVIASGNNGFCNGIGGPGCISTAIAVGATTDSDTEASFSNFHPTLLDLFAPGDLILSSVGANDSAYNSYSGTSMATPHVAGAWALMRDVYPSMSVSDVLSRLQSTGATVAGRCTAGVTQRRIQLDAAVIGFKFDQPPEGEGENIASNIDWSDQLPNIVVADDFVSDGRPIDSVHWWGSLFGTPGGGGGAIYASDPASANLGVVDATTGEFTIIGPFTGAVGQVTEIEWSPDGSTLYATTGGGGSTIHTIDPTTGSVIGSVGHPFGAINGLEFDGGGNLLGTFVPGPGGPSDLVVIDPIGGSMTVVGPTGYSNIGGLAFDASFTTLYGITSGGAAIPPVLLSVNPATGTATPIANTTMSVEASSLEFTSDGRLITAGADGILYELNPTTAAATPIGPLVSAGKLSGISVGGAAVSCDLQNGGFESGNFSDWTAVSNGLAELCPWTVSGSPGSCWFPTTPLSGSFDAWTGFDGDAGLMYELYQDITLPAAGSVILNTNHRIQYDSLGIPSVLPRTLDISIRDTSNFLLMPLYHQDVFVNLAPPTDLGWNNQGFDISAFAGQTIRVHFEINIPEAFTGPGQIEFDDISIVCSALRPSEPVRIHKDSTIAGGGTLPAVADEAKDAYVALRAGSGTREQIAASLIHIGGPTHPTADYGPAGADVRVTRHTRQFGPVEMAAIAPEVIEGQSPTSAGLASAAVRSGIAGYVVPTEIRAALDRMITRSGIKDRPIEVSSRALTDVGSGAERTITYTRPEEIASVRTAQELGVQPIAAIDAVICGAPFNVAWNSDVQAKLLGTGQFTSVSIINVNVVTPSLLDLQAFDAALVYSDVSYADSTTLGNVMADYVDSGGGVVVAIFEVGSGGGSDPLYLMQGRWNTDSYFAIPRSGQTGGAAGMGTVFDPSHPIMQGVSSFNGGSSSFRQSTTSISGGSTRIADWSDGRALVATKTIGGVPRADLGFFPPSSDARSDFWATSSDGALLMANALTYASGPTGGSGDGYGWSAQQDRVAEIDLAAPESLILSSGQPNGGSGTPFWNAQEFGNTGDFSFLYALNSTDNRFARMDVTTGAVTNIGIATPVVGQTWGGLAMDPTSGVMYASSTSCAASTLYTIDLTTGAATVVGTMTNSPCNVAIAINASGQLYGHDVINDSLISFDKTTGAGTIIGPLGFDANFGQGMDFDASDGTLYLASVNNTTFQAELRIAHTTTGATTMIGGAIGSVFPGGINQVTGLGIAAAASGGCGPIINGDFETGDLSGWTVVDTGGFGTYVINDGTHVPFSGDGPLPPCGGNYTAMTDQGGGGSHTLYQDVTIPAGWSGACLSWTDMIRNHAGTFVDPGQEFRVEIRNPVTDAVLETVFSTNPGDVALQNCTARSANISAYVGQTVRIAFVEEDSLFYFNLHVDDVCLTEDACGAAAVQPDGFFISFHEPKTLGGSPDPPLGLYYCDRIIVDAANVGLPNCDSHQVIEYGVDLADCCLVFAGVDLRSGNTPAQPDAFYEETCFDYALDIQAVVGVRFVPDGFGGCTETLTPTTADDDFWGWHTTDVERGVAYGLQQAIETTVTIPPPDWLYGPWTPIAPTCSLPNMAFRLITNTLAETPPDSDGDGVPDVCVSPDPPIASADGDKVRHVSFVVPATSAGSDTGLRVELASLHHPSSPPPGTPNFATFEGGFRYVNSFGGSTTCVDSATLSTNFRCGQLGCQPEYRDWATDLASATNPASPAGLIHITGDSVVPSSTLHVSHIVSACGAAPGADSCSLASGFLAVSTARWGDVGSGGGGGPDGTANVIDIGLVVDNVKGLATAIPERRAWMKNPPNTALNPVNVIDIGLTIDSVKGLPYPYGIAACP